MKWCIQCHKRTEVNPTHDNAYYDKMIAMHDLIKKNKDNKNFKVTEAMMGGIECGKCHY